MMENMDYPEYLVIDLTGTETREELHRRLADALEFPAWYGGNLDALYDLLAETQDTLVLICRQRTRELLGDYFEVFRRVCLDAESENPDLEIIFA